MPRIRSIKPELWDDEALGGCPVGARLLFLGMISHADDCGRLRANPALLKARIFAYNDDLGLEEVTAWTNALSFVGVVRLYDNEGQTYAEIVNWLKHQRISHPSASCLPAPEDSRILATIREGRPLQAHGGYDTVLESDALQDFPEDSGGPVEDSGDSPNSSVGKGREGRGKEGTTPTSLRDKAIAASEILAGATWPGGVVDVAKVELVIRGYPEDDCLAAAAVAMGWRASEGFLTEHAHAALGAAFRWAKKNPTEARELAEKSGAAKVYDLREHCRECKRKLEPAERSAGWCDKCFDERAERILGGEDGAA